MGTEAQKPRLGLLTSFLPMLTSTSRPDPRASVEVPRKPLPASYHSPTNTVTTMTTGTTRTSEDSRSSSRAGFYDASLPRRDTGSASLSPVEQVSPFPDSWSFASPDPKMQTAPAMPTSPPPLPPPTPPVHLPAITATQASPREGNRSPSPDHPPSRAIFQPNRLQPRHAPPSDAPRGRSVSAQPPPIRAVSAESPRAVSTPVNGPPPPAPLLSPPPPPSEKKRSRKSWFPGVRSRSSSGSRKPKDQSAWIMSPDSRADYNPSLLVSGEMVPELWNELGNVFVYLHPKGSGRGPSFKVVDQVFSASAVLNELLVAEMTAAPSHDAQYPELGSAAAGPVAEGHLYLPLERTDLEHLIAARNLFAFLTRQPLVGTTEHPTVFEAVLQIAALLRRFNFCSADGSSFGNWVSDTFNSLVEQFGLADVRNSREKTLEALVMAEQMKSWELYNEAFVHAVGKYESLMDLKSPLYSMISVSTRNRLERAHLDLVNRQANVSSRLESFEFPALFAGIASSSTGEFKDVKFKEWRSHFGKMRSFVLGYYKNLFGSWPPRAKSRKNHFTQSGLNRQCLKILYSDLCALYDLLVDRESLTPRVIGEFEDPQGGYSWQSQGDSWQSQVDASISALRKLLDEFEKSSPPVLPPIPFDIPKIPSMTAIYENYHDLPAKKQAKYNKSLKPHELQLLLLKSRNIDTDALQMPFLLAFKDFELQEAKGLHPQDLVEQRIGYWVFLYVVLQSLPMLVIDAPNLQYTDGVEDFLCEAPQGNPPWCEDAGEVRKKWYQTGQNIVELSADVVMFSVEGIYMRSHCWLAAKEWEASGPSAAPPPAPDFDPAALEPPRPVFHDMDPSPGNQSQQSQQQQQQRPVSTAGRSAPSSPHLRPRRSSITDRARMAFRASMLEPLPLPEMHAAAAEHHRRGSRVVSSGSAASSGSGAASSTLGVGGEVYQLGLRASRSAVNLGLGQGVAGGVDIQSRKSSYGGSGSLGGGSVVGAPGPAGHTATESLGGGSTFDDILKGMDKGKKKKRLFF